MKSQIAENVLNTSFSLSAAASLAEARATYANLAEKEPGRWTARLSGGHRDDAIDIRITVRDDMIVEIWVRATAWNVDEGREAWRKVTNSISRRYGQPAKYGKGASFARRVWPELRSETISAEKRVSDEGGYLLTQIIVTRAFKQPDADGQGEGSLFDLMVEPSVHIPATASPGFRDRMRTRTPTADSQRPLITYRNVETKFPNRFICKGGPHRPKWPKGKSRPMQACDPVHDPCFARINYNVDSTRLAEEISAVETAFDVSFQRSTWHPFHYVDCEGTTHHSARWWWLGGGMMLHVCARESKRYNVGESTVLIEGFCDLDCSPDQAVKPAPAHDQVLRWMSNRPPSGVPHNPSNSWSGQ